MEEEARRWNAANPDEPVSTFACKFVGKYREASDALRKVRKEEKK